METTFVSISYEETRQIAKKFAEKLEKGTTVCLFGELAAGKTTFTQGIGQAFGIERLISPTFLIMRQYPVASHPVIKTLFHLDLYRLNSIDDIKAFDVEEIWSAPENLLVIEWPEKFAKNLPKDRFDIFFKTIGDNERQIIIHEHK